MLSPTGEEETQEEKRVNKGKPIIPLNMEGAASNTGENDKFTLILEKLAKLDSMEQQLTGIISTQTAMQTGLSEMSDKVTNLELHCTRLEDDVLKSDARFNELERRNAYLERELNRAKEVSTQHETFMKQNNLIFSGVDEQSDVLKGSCVEAIGDILTNQMGIEPGSLIIIDCYRLGPIKQVRTPGETKHPRPILVKCNTRSDRNIIWGRKAQLKDTDWYISDDYPKEIERRRAILYPIMKLARSIEGYQGKTYMAGDRLVVNKKKYSIDQLEELPADLNPRLTSTQTVNNMTFFFSRHSPLSNHHPAPFRILGTMYSCSEQRYFQRKAEYLGDDMAKDAVMAERDAKAVLNAGKKIVNKNKKCWEDVEVKEMTDACRAKFAQNPKARAALLATEHTELAECSPFDGHWGIKMRMTDPEKTNKQKWATNLMGGVLSLLREEFRVKEPDQMQQN